GAGVMGGRAGGGRGLNQGRLFLDGGVVSEGAVGAYLPQAEVHPLVAQGCRPLGDPYTTTRAEGNVILELGGRPPVVRLQELAATLSSPDRELLAPGLPIRLRINHDPAAAPP